jgi:protease YdgD
VRARFLTAVLLSIAGPCVAGMKPDSSLGEQYQALSQQLREAPSKANVFQGNRREVSDSRAYPFRAVGRLTLPGNEANWCTAVLMSEDVILTNAHCAEKSDDYVFHANVIAGQAAETSPAKLVAFGAWFPEQIDRMKDWAILRLAVPLGKTYGWYGSKVVDFGKTPQLDVNIVAYPNDAHGGTSPTREAGCGIKKLTLDGLLHDCSTTRGASGAPLYVVEDGKPYLVALNCAEFRDGGEISLTGIPYSDKHANIAVPVVSFLDALKPLIAR